MAGSHEVRGSIPLSSTINLMAGSETNRPFSLLSAQRSARDCDSGTDHAPPSSPWLHTRVNMVSYERDAGGRRSGSEQAIAHGGEDARNRHLVGVSLPLLLLALVAALLALPGAYTPPAFADEDAPEGKRIVRVGYYEDGDYMSYDEAGQLVGYNIDYLEELRRYADWTYEYVGFRRMGRSLRGAGERRDRPAPRRVLHPGARGPHAVLGRAHVQHLHHAQRAPGR